MNDLTEKLISSNPQTLGRNILAQETNRYRMTLLYQKGKNYFDSGLEHEPWQKEKKMYHSIIEEPDLGWNSQQIMERTLLMEDESNQIQNNQGEQDILINNSIATSKSKPIYNYNIKHSNIAQQQKPKGKQLNHRIFNMAVGAQKCLYYFNIIFSFFFRVGLIVLLIELIIEGDGDKNKNQQKIFVSVLLGLQGLVGLLYFLALTKMLYTKSSDISVYFQKQFYEKPYAEIHMERILRKHFTAQKIVSNLCRLANPFTKFSKDIRISIMRQQIYKRIQLIIIFVPLAVMFIMGTPWFDKNNEIDFKFDVKLLLAIVVCIEACRFTIHYIIVYIFS